jgi:hypothetical protein
MISFRQGGELRPFAEPTRTAHSTGDQGRERTILFKIIKN